MLTWLIALSIVTCGAGDTAHSCVYVHEVRPEYSQITPEHCAKAAERFIWRSRVEHKGITYVCATKPE